MWSNILTGKEWNEKSRLTQKLRWRLMCNRQNSNELYMLIYSSEIFRDPPLKCYSVGVMAHGRKWVSLRLQYTY